MTRLHLLSISSRFLCYSDDSQNLRKEKPSQRNLSRGPQLNPSHVTQQHSTSIPRALLHHGQNRQQHHHRSPSRNSKLVGGHVSETPLIKTPSTPKKAAADTRDSADATSSNANKNSKGVLLLTSEENNCHYSGAWTYPLISINSCGSELSERASEAKS